MAKRFFATDIWEEDWFLDMPNEYKQFWFYILAKCDHAGIFKVNVRSFRGLVGVELGSSKALTLFNTGKQRIRIIKDDVWLIEDFFVYQYGPVMNLQNKVHNSIAKIYKKHGVSLTSIRGLKDLKDGVKDKDKDKELESNEDNKGGLGEKEGEERESEDLPNIVIYDIEQYLIDHQKDFEVLGMDATKAGLSPPQFKELIKKFHLWNQSKEHYPKRPLALIAGLKTWIINEKKTINGAHKSDTAGSSESKLGTSAARVNVAKKW